jgi:hypothetical protein
LQNTAVINGRPAIYGDAALALVRASGLLDSYVEEEIGEAGKDTHGYKVTVTRKGSAASSETFTVADAKQAKLWGKLVRGGLPAPDAQVQSARIYPARPVRGRAQGATHGRGGSGHRAGDQRDPFGEARGRTQRRGRRWSMSITDLEDALGAIRRLKVQIDRLNEEIEKNAWTSSPALAQAQIDQLASTVRGLERENEKLAKDKARLDWIEVNADQIHCSKSGAGNIEMYWIAPTRAAIDAAMEGEAMSTATDLRAIFLDGQRTTIQHEHEIQKKMNEHDIKKQAVINTATEQFRSLLETHFESITKAATDSFIDDESETEPKAKATVNIEWDSLASAPKINVKIGYSVRYKDESETVIDPLQSKLGLDAEDNS